MKSFILEEQMENVRSSRTKEYLPSGIVDLGLGDFVFRRKQRGRRCGNE